MPCRGSNTLGFQSSRPLAGKGDLGGGYEAAAAAAMRSSARTSGPFPAWSSRPSGWFQTWEGCTQMLMRQSFPVFRYVQESSRTVARCRGSCEIPSTKRKEMQILRAGDGINTMNHLRVLARRQWPAAWKPRRITHHPAGDRASAQRMLTARHRQQGQRGSHAQRQDHQARRGCLPSFGTSACSAAEIRISHLRSASSSCSISEQAAFMEARQDRGDIQAHRPYGRTWQAVQGADPCARSEHGALTCQCEMERPGRNRNGKAATEYGTE